MASNSAPSILVNLPPIYRGIYYRCIMRMYHGIKIYRYLWSTDAMGFQAVSVNTRVENLPAWLQICGTRYSPTRFTQTWSGNDWYGLWEDIPFYMLGLLLGRLTVFRFLFPNFGAAHFRPRPCNFRIRFCAVSSTRFETTSQGLTSGDVLLVMFLKIVPPVRNATRPTALTPIQKTRVTVRNRPLKKLPFPCPHRIKGGTD